VVTATGASFQCTLEATKPDGTKTATGTAELTSTQ
jgi:hypothetical protein